MPIPASVAAKYERVQFTAQELDILQQLEKQIDDAIEKNYNGGEIPCTIPSQGVGVKVIRELARRYSHVGWRVTVKSINAPGALQLANGQSHEIIAYQFVLVAREDTDSLRQEVVEAALALVAVMRADSVIIVGERERAAYNALDAAVQAYQTH